MSDDYIDIAFTKVEAITPMAILFKIDDKEYWIPKSQMQDKGEGVIAGDTNVEVAMTKWIAGLKELV